MKNIFYAIQTVDQHPEHKGWYRAQEILQIFNIQKKHANSYLTRHVSVDNRKQLHLGNVGRPPYFMNSKGIWEFILKPDTNDEKSREVLYRLIDQLSKFDFKYFEDIDFDINCDLPD